VNQAGRATSFGRDASAYERARPGYPDAVFAHILGMITPGRAVEVGAGTGKATSSVARPGLELTCLEPSVEMASMLEGRALPGVTVVRDTFEDWEPGDGGFDLLFAAQAWHWVDRGVGPAKARRVLGPGGLIALFWNHPRGRYDQFADVYARHAPQILDEQDERIRLRDEHDWRVDLEAAGFGEVGLFSHEWSTEMSAAALRELYSTYSDHILLPDEVRSALLDALEAAVVDRGGTVLQQYTTRLFTGRN
jgi:SAM-dependent methyltransferase